MYRAIHARFAASAALLALTTFAVPVQADEGTRTPDAAVTDEGAGADDQADDQPDAPDEGLNPEFSFGSYGRVQYDFDGSGNRGYTTNVVSHGPRILEESYAELDFRTRIQTDGGFGTRVLATVALISPFAHFDADFVDQALAVRNLYAEAWGFVPALPQLSLWAGSRMYRGDDVYLLDWWPMDELNTIGGGVAWKRGGLDLRLHVGVNRLDNDYQLQSVEVPNSGFGSREKLMMERQRTIGSARAAYVAEDLVGQTGAKAVVYGEVHALPGGQRIRPNLLENGAPVYPEERATETLPADNGYSIGGQLGLFGFGPSSHLNLFFKLSRGLAAYGEFGVPFGVSDDNTATGAQDIVAAVSGNWETPGRHFGLMAGGYWRRFNDADDQRIDNDDFAEGAAVLRPIWFATEHFHQALEVSWQTRRPFGTEFESGAVRVPQVLQLSVMEIIGLKRGSYARPHLRLHYTLSLSNEAARNQYVEGDVRRPAAVEHFVGIGAEWWFNSSRY